MQILSLAVGAARHEVIAQLYATSEDITSTLNNNQSSLKGHVMGPTRFGMQSAIEISSVGSM